MFGPFPRVDIVITLVDEKKFFFEVFRFFS
jgi:hypothetical protein